MNTVCNKIDGEKCIFQNEVFLHTSSGLINIKKKFKTAFEFQDIVFEFRSMEK